MSQMFPGVRDTFNPLGGECRHFCRYCFIRSLKMYPELKKKYSGPVRLHPPAYKNLKNSKMEGFTVFVCDCTDLFAEEVPPEMVNKVMDLCRAKNNQYLFLTKNPAGFRKATRWPDHFYAGITLETNRDTSDISMAPEPITRKNDYIKNVPKDAKRCISIEPIMAFDTTVFANILEECAPERIYIGADSCGCHLPEPTEHEILMLVSGILARLPKVEIIPKKNLWRIVKHPELLGDLLTRGVVQ